jgi:hypothetical protein
VSVRLHVNINDETAEALRHCAEVRGTTVTEVVRRSVSVLAFFEKARRRGYRLRLVDTDGTITWVELL